MKKYVKALLVSLAATVSLALSGCGGGDDGSKPVERVNNDMTIRQAKMTRQVDPNDPVLVKPVVDQKITVSGGVGYMTPSKVTVCFDDGAGGCDSSLPTVETTSAWNIQIPLTSNVVGRQLNVFATYNTVMNGNDNLPKTIPLSAIVINDTMYVNMLTTIMAHEYRKGKSLTEARDFVRELTNTPLFSGWAYSDWSEGSKMNVYNTTLVRQITDRIPSGGTATARAVGLAIEVVLAQRDVPSRFVPADYTAILVDDDYSQPVSSSEALSALGSSLYVIDTEHYKSIPGVYPPTRTVVRENYNLNNSTLARTEESQINGVWAPVTNLQDSVLTSPNGNHWEMQGGYSSSAFIRKDNTWVWPAKNALQMHQRWVDMQAVSQPTSGLLFKEELTSDPVHVQYRKVDLSGLPLAIAISEGYNLYGDNYTANRLIGVFPDNTFAYIATETHPTAGFILSTTAVGTSVINGVLTDTPVTIDGAYASVLGGNSLYNSVTDVVGMEISFGKGFSGGSFINCLSFKLNPDNTAVFDKTNKPGCNYGQDNNSPKMPLTTAWHIDQDDPSIIVLDVPRVLKAYNFTNGSVPAPYGPLQNAAQENWSIVIALKSNRLMSGFMRQAGAQKNLIMFSDPSVVDLVASKILSS